MIISATRRADIPAHYAKWFCNRVQVGWCATPNPFNAKQISRISLKPEDVSALIFWTRDPRPLLPHLKDLDRRCFRYVFQFTLVEYPPAIHPGMPPVRQRIEAFKRLSDAIGPERVLWRYDPVLLTRDADCSYHRENFASLAGSLSGHTERVTVSLMEPYKKIRARLEMAGAIPLVPREAELAGMFRSMAEAAMASGMTPLSCADEAGLADLGFKAGACVDAALLNRLFGLSLPGGKDSSQRPACRCAPSRDIGMYDACPAGCAYCYATRDFACARNAKKTHDPASPSLLGRHDPGPMQGSLLDSRE